MPRAKAVAGQPVYLIDGARTPFLKARGSAGSFSASDLAVAAIKPLLARMPMPADTFDEVITGCVGAGPDEANIGRVIALRAGCGNSTPGWTVHRNCASGLQSIDCAYANIALGRSELVLAGGTEAMSRSALLWNDTMVAWLSKWRMAKTFQAKAALLLQIRPRFLAPIFALVQGLTDPVVGIIMGATAENLAHQFNISREAMDAFSVMSHERLAAAQDQKLLTEIVPLYGMDGRIYLEDDGVRRDSTIESLAKLKPVFDKPFGTVTAGNSSQVTDGAAFVVLAGESAVERYDLPVRARITQCKWAGLDPAVMGLGPVHATAKLLTAAKLKVSDIDYWELNEAFAAQVLACLAAMESEQYCRDVLGLKSALGKIPMDRLNIHGGAIAIGHPIGATGSRLVLHLMNVLEQKQAKRAIATLCIGGGQGGAMLIERV